MSQPVATRRNLSQLACFTSGSLGFVRSPIISLGRRGNKQAAKDFLRKAIIVISFYGRLPKLPMRHECDMIDAFIGHIKLLDYIQQ